MMYVEKLPDTDMGALVKSDDKCEILSRVPRHLPEGCGENLKNGIYFCMISQDGHMTMVDYVESINVEKPWMERVGFDFDDRWMSKAVFKDVPQDMETFIDVVKSSECGVLVFRKGDITPYRFVHLLGYVEDFFQKS